MELLLYLLICCTKELITIETNDTTITYKGTGTLTKIDGLKSFGKKIIIIEEGITAIENEAFYQVTLPLPGEDSFQYEKVYVPRSLETIGNFAFSSVDSKMTTFLFPKWNGSVPINKATEEEVENFYALRSIGKGAFMNCHLLTAANIPGTFTSLEDFVFMGVPFTGISLNSKIKSIGIGSFQNCNKLTHITIPSAVTSIGDYAFGNCTSLSIVNFNGTTCKYGGECFKNCAALKEFTFPKSAELSLPGGLFQNCASLTKCTMPTTLTNENEVESPTINMFENCQQLSVITLPTNLKGIGARMFKNTSVETLYLPKSVSRIGLEAFQDCTKLKYVNVSCTDPVTLGLNIFDNTPNLELLSIHGDLSENMGEDMFGGKKFCYYGNKNPVGSKLSLNPDTTTVYVTESFKKDHEYFGSPGNTSLDGFNGYECQVMQGNDCSFPGEPAIPTESESMNYSDEISVSESELASTEEPSGISESPSAAPTDSNNNNNNKKKKKKLSTGAIIGIVIGCLAFLALLILLIVCCCKKKNNHIETKDEKKDSSIALKKNPSKKDYESVDNLKENQPEKLMV